MKDKECKNNLFELDDDARDGVAGVTG